MSDKDASGISTGPRGVSSEDARYEARLDVDGGAERAYVVAQVKRGRRLMALSVAFGVLSALLYTFSPLPESQKGALIRIVTVIFCPFLIIWLKAFVESKVFRCPHCNRLPYADWQLDDDDLTMVRRTEFRLLDVLLRGLLSCPESCGACGGPLSDTAYDEIA